MFEQGLQETISPHAAPSTFDFVTLTFSLSGVAPSTALRGAGVAIDPGEEDERGEDTPEDAGPHGRSVGGRLRSREREGGTRISAKFLFPNYDCGGDFFTVNVYVRRP